MKGNLLYFYPAVSLQRTRELSPFLFHVLSRSLPPDLWKLYEWGWRWRNGRREGTGRRVHVNTQTHMQGKEWDGGK